MPKANIDVAIARGQGKSLTGQGLESATLEVMLPLSSSAVAMVIDIETDNKQRSLKDLRNIVKKYGANVSPTAFLFERLGRTVLQQQQGAASDEEFDDDDALMQALDAGADDVEGDGDGNMVVWTQPSATHQVAQKLSASLGRSILSSDIIYAPAGPDRVRIDDAEAATGLGSLLAAVHEYPDVQAVYANVERGEVAEEIWKTVEENLDS